MRLPVELEHLIRTAQHSQTISTTQSTPLSARLDAIEARKALEVEHYLRVFALRLDLVPRNFPRASQQSAVPDESGPQDDGGL